MIIKLASLPPSRISCGTTKIINGRRWQHPKIYTPLQTSKIPESPITRLRCRKNDVGAKRQHRRRFR